MEWAHPEARLWPSAFLPCCFSIGTMATALLAWLSPTWTKLHLSMSLPQLACLPLFLYVFTPPFFILFICTEKESNCFVCLLSSIPESPRWLLLKKRMDILERYRNNSPKDKHFLDLVTKQSLDSRFSTCCFWVTDSSYLDESHVMLFICCPARNSSITPKKETSIWVILLSKCWLHVTFL